MTRNTAVIGPDGLPIFADDPPATAERAAELADELAADVEHLMAQLDEAAEALDQVREDWPASMARIMPLARVQLINRQVHRALKAIQDRLGEQHVECDELAEVLRRLLDAGSGDIGFLEEVA